MVSSAVEEAHGKDEEGMGHSRSEEEDKRAEEAVVVLLEEVACNDGAVEVALSHEVGNQSLVEHLMSLRSYYLLQCFQKTELVLIVAALHSHCYHLQWIIQQKKC